MAAFSTRLIATAQRLLRAYGQSVSFSRVVEGAFVPSTGAVGSGTTTTYTAYGAPASYSLYEINNTTIMSDDVVLWAEVGNTIPAIGDVATVSGTAYRVLNVKKLIAQGNTIVYKLQLRI